MAAPRDTFVDIGAAKIDPVQYGLAARFLARHDAEDLADMILDPSQIITPPPANGTPRSRRYTRTGFTNTRKVA
ncbi:hypothetical protein [Acidipropionibacterium timonense]|uniref:hypothetical protein n=1 Tax=Acidipropionibacterium timonense TaxID=2161818 RepID=UPI00102F3503|nr:hypothetical protein [Acidipropionibacterium timonense]